MKSGSLMPVVGSRELAVTRKIENQGISKIVIPIPFMRKDFGFVQWGMDKG